MQLQTWRRTPGGWLGLLLLTAVLWWTGGGVGVVVADPTRTGNRPQTAADEIGPLARASLAEDWPHWPATQWPTVRWLERFIERHAEHPPLAVFDFDGTLFSEQYLAPDGELRSGQSTWRVWGADQLERHPYLFPRFRLGFGPAEDRAAILQLDRVLEGMTNVESRGYMKFTQLSTFEAGMTPAEMQTGMAAFLDAWPPADHAFLPMFDLLQRMLDRGFTVWIVSGSHPLYIHATLRRLTETCTLRPGRRYDLRGLLTDDWRPRSAEVPGGSRILGNCPRLDAAGRFTAVYDGRRTTAPDGRLFVLEGEGKRLALERWLEPLEGRRAWFAAGNSDADVEMLASVLGRGRDTGHGQAPDPGAAALLVNPRGQRFSALAGPRSIRVEMIARSGRR